MRVYFLTSDSSGLFITSKHISEANRETALGPFAELRKATSSFVMSLCLSVHIEQLGSHWTDFRGRENSILIIM